MTFGAPICLWAFAAFPVLIAIFFANEQRRKQLLTKLVAARLLPRLAGSVSVAKRRARFLLVLLGLAAAIVALAQPRYGFDWEQTKRKGRDVLIAVDTSRSMLANDLAPNRLTRAKLAAQDLIGELQGDRVGVVAFAGTAFLQAPLTVDYGAVLNALNELDTEIIPQGGTNIAEMIRTAREAFGKGESENRALIVFTDGEELDTDGIKAAAEASGEVRIFTVGVGSIEGALIPLSGRGRSTEFVKDDSGQIVKTRLDEERLRKIAESTGGFYLRLQSGRPEMSQIIRDGLGKMSEKEIDAKLSRRPIERYQWPLSAALALLAASTLIGERRRGAGLRTAAAALVLTLMPLGAQAINPGVEAYRRQDYPGARQQFSDQLKLQPESPELQFNLGSAAYKAGDLDQALAAFSKAVTSPDPHLRTCAAFNLGNTLFQRGVAQSEKPAKIQEWKNALQHYEQALKVEPQNADAIYNRDVVRKLLEELEKEQKQEDQKKDDQKKDDDKKDQKDQQKQDQKDQQGQQQPKDGQKDEKKDQSSGSPQDKDGQQKEDQQPQEKPGKEDGKQDPQKSKEEQGAKDDQQKQAKNDAQKPGKEGQSGEKSEPSPEQAQPMKQGDLKPAQPGEQKDDAQAEEAADAQAAAEGKMTEQQAKALLESLKNEDDKVHLVDPHERQKTGRVFKDW
jgi:Ca-activated chloride channel homolog